MDLFIQEKSTVPMWYRFLQCNQNHVDEIAVIICLFILVLSIISFTNSFCIK